MGYTTLKIAMGKTESSVVMDSLNACEHPGDLALALGASSSQGVKPENLVSHFVIVGQTYQSINEPILNSSLLKAHAGLECECALVETF